MSKASKATTAKNVENEAPVTDAPVNTELTIEQQLAQAKAEAKAALEELEALKAKKSAPKEKREPRVSKGQMVTFTNSAGDQITGLGVLYYVTRMNKKLYYKEASTVHVMTPEEIKDYEAEEARKAPVVTAPKVEDTKVEEPKGEDLTT